MQQRRARRAVEPDHRAALDLCRLGAGQQHPIDLLPGLGAHRADRLVQHRLLRTPAHRQPREGTERGGVLQVKRQLLVAQLAVLLQQTRAQHRLGRKPVASGLLDPVTTQVGGDQARQLTMPVEPLRHRPQLAADLVRREDIEYTGLDDAFLAHCRLRRSKVCFGFSGMIPNAYLKPPELTRANDRFIQLFQRLAVCGRALASRPEIVHCGYVRTRRAPSGPQSPVSRSPSVLSASA